MDSLKSCCWAHFVTAVFQVGYFVPCVTTIVDLQNVYDEELRILWGGIATNILFLVINLVFCIYLDVMNRVLRKGESLSKSFFKVRRLLLSACFANAVFVGGDIGLLIVIGRYMNLSGDNYEFGIMFIAPFSMGVCAGVTALVAILIDGLKLRKMKRKWNKRSNAAKNDGNGTDERYILS